MARFYRTERNGLRIVEPAPIPYEEWPIDTEEQRNARILQSCIDAELSARAVKERTRVKRERDLQRKRMLRNNRIARNA